MNDEKKDEELTTKTQEKPSQRNIGSMEVSNKELEWTGTGKTGDITPALLDSSNMNLKDINCCQGEKWRII